MRLVYEPILPNGYTRLEYIESTGTQYIDTGYTITEEDNIDAIYDIALTNISGRGLMGYSLTQVGYWGKTASNTYELGGGNTQVATGNRDIVRFKRDVISSMRQDTDLYINGVVIGHAQRSTTAEIGPFQIFACRGSFKMSGKLYGATLTINDEQIRKFIPALRNSDLEPGMYDIVSGTFYTNAGTGIFNYKISTEEDIVDNPRYQQVEYIESTGSQYIDTGFIPNQDTRIISEFEYTKDPGNTGFIFGAGYSATDRAFELYTWTNNWNSPYGNTNIIVGTNVSLLTSGKIYADKNKNTILIRYSDGTEQTGQTDYTEFTVPNRNIWLFSINRGSTVFLADCVRLYSCKIYDDNKLIRNFIPVIRKIDNKPGMYDKITKQFYTNAYTGDDFLYGEKVYNVLPSKYEKLEYLESTGTQWIDTGILANGSFDAEYKIKTDSSNTGVCIVAGARTSTQHLNFGQFEPNNHYFIFAYLNTYWSIPNKISSNTEYETKVHYESGNQYAVLNGETIGNKTLSGTERLDMNIYLFKRNFHTPSTESIQPMIGRMYYFRIWNNNVLVRDFIPALRKADNKPGMYDFVSGQFFTNIGTGEFTYDYPTKPLSNSKLRLVKTGGYTIYDDLYKEVEYLESTGTQYIDTGVYLDENTVFDVEASSTDDDVMIPFGILGMSNDPTAVVYLKESYTSALWGALRKVDCSGVSKFDKHTMHLDKDKFIIDGEEATFSDTGFSGTSVGTIPILGVLYQGAYYGRNVRMFSCKIYDGSTLVRDYIPVIRITDNKPGMYDKITKEFYTNAGTGEFIYPTPTLTKPLVTRLIAGGYV